MRFGFIGTGGISQALINGIYSVGINELGISKIAISRRSKHRSSKLSSRYEEIQVCDENQEIVDQSDWIFLAVLPEHAEAVVQELSFGVEKQLVSLVAGLSVERLSELTGIANVVRIIPLPPVEIAHCPIPIFPAHPQVEKFLDQIGTSIPIDNESHFTAFSAASAIMATHFEFLGTIAKWIHLQGLPKGASARYATALLSSLTEQCIGADYQTLLEMSEECLTPGGLNEQVLLNKRGTRWFNSIHEQLDQILERIK